MKFIVYEQNAEKKGYKIKLFNDLHEANTYVWSIKPSQDRRFFTLPYEKEWEEECLKLANEWFDACENLLKINNKYGLDPYSLDILDKKYKKETDKYLKIITEIKQDVGFESFLKKVRNIK